MNLEKRLYGYDTEIDFYDIDYLHRMKLSSLLRIFARIAGEDYTDRGMSHVFLKEHGYVFLVSKVAYKIYRMPVMEEKVRVNTWVIGTKGAKFLRGYEMLSENGEKLVEAESVWICVEPETRSIVRPSSFEWQVEPLDKEELSVHCKNIRAEEIPLYKSQELVISDIDGNGHLNNAIYADIITNALTKQEFENEISEVYLNYSHEAYLGETLDIYKGSTEDGMTMLAKVGERPCFECILKFR